MKRILTSKIDIKKRIVENLSSAAESRTIADARIGLTYTAVRLDNGDMGLAYTFLDSIPRGCRFFSSRGGLRGKPAAEVLEMLNSPVQIERAAGLAAANALAVSLKQRFTPGDSRELVELEPGDTVGMVGHFEPLVSDIESRVKSLLIFEIEQNASPGMIPAGEAPARLPRCDVVIITATSIVNDTIDSLLAACGNSRETVILGASTPLVKGVFAGTAATLLSGVQVIDPELVLRVVSEGGGMRSFKAGIKKVNIRV